MFRRGELAVSALRQPGRRKRMTAHKVKELALFPYSGRRAANAKKKRSVDESGTAAMIKGNDE